MASSRMGLSLLCACLLLSAPAQGFQLPGMKPLDYEERAPIPVFVNKLFSTKTQMPFRYYRLPFCRPARVEESHENIGQILSGDRTETSAYDVQMRVAVSCAVLCTQTYDEKRLNAFKRFIREDYHANLLIDNLPVSHHNAVVDLTQSGARLSMKGFPLGEILRDGFEIYNHVTFHLRYHTTKDNTYRVVGASATPMSIRHEGLNGASTCNANSQYGQHESATPDPIVTGTASKEIVWSYTVEWEEDPNLEWASRWDVYLTNVRGGSVAWTSILNSFLIVLGLTFMVACIFIRTVYRDIARYNDYLPITESKEDEQEESGWKLLHADVFRPPQRFVMLFSVLVGTGIQLFYMTLVVLALLFLGFITPSSRGTIITASLMIFVLLSSINGYFAARVYKFFRGVHWKALTFATSTFFPGLILAVQMLMNIFAVTQGSSRSMPFRTVASLLLLWMGVSIPLVFFGSFYGFKKDPYDVPCKQAMVPRVVPKQPWYNQTFLAMLLAGLIPFSSIILILNSVMSSIWLHQLFAMFSSLFLVFLVTVLSIVEVTIILCYFQLIYEDYNWWWRSLFNGGALGFYIFVYSSYYGSMLGMTKLSTFMIYYGSMVMVCSLVSLLTSALGFYFTFAFTRKLYSMVKCD